MTTEARRYLDGDLSAIGRRLNGLSRKLKIDLSSLSFEQSYELLFRALDKGPAIVNLAFDLLVGAAFLTNRSPEAIDIHGAMSFAESARDRVVPAARFTKAKKRDRAPPPPSSDAGMAHSSEEFTEVRDRRRRRAPPSDSEMLSRRPARRAPAAAALAATAPARTVRPPRRSAENPSGPRPEMAETEVAPRTRRTPHPAAALARPPAPSQSSAPAHTSPRISAESSDTIVSVAVRELVDRMVVDAEQILDAVAVVIASCDRPDAPILPPPAPVLAGMKGVLLGLLRGHSGVTTYVALRTTTFPADAHPLICDALLRSPDPDARRVGVQLLVRLRLPSADE